MTVKETIAQIRPLDADAMEAAWKHWDSIAKPLRSLGKLEQVVVQAAGIQRTPRVDLAKKALIVLCADNGVVEEGVTQTGQEVTAQVAENFLQEKATAGILCRKTGADIFPVDMGIYRDTCIRNCKIAYGTRNMAREPAMTREQAVQGIETGISLAFEKKREGYQLLATGEMGIGNTTTSSAMASVLLRRDAEEMTGRGAGLSSAGLNRKVETIKKAIALHRPDPEDPVDVLAKVGGFDLAGMIGVYLGGAAAQMPVVIDGFISCVAALTAMRICPTAGDYMIASHVSKEPAAELILKALGKEAVIHGDMCLGEGSGAVALFPFLDMGIAVYESMSTFEDIKVDQYEELV